jgi:uncharacterized membrane protein YagU involved in acid resistance
MAESDTVQAAQLRRRGASVPAAIACGGLIAGTIDIGSACLINQLPPRVILHAIASGVLGAASFRGGVSAELVGLGLQWVMSLLIAALFVVATARLAGLRRSWIGAGVAYGVVIYIVMTFVVVPLSAAPFHPHFIAVKIIENLLAMILFGLIVAGAARAFLPAPPHGH